ncbi:MAG: tyrosine-type recombinase/integrase [Solirubrobacteraceae bacterium]
MAALPDPQEQDRLAERGDRRARERLAAAAAAGQPLVDPLGRQRSPVTLPEYRKGRAPANKGRRFPPEPLTNDEIQAILDALPRGAAGTRNRALIVVMWRAGLRIAEALALLPKDVDLEQCSVTVLQGKGAKRRVAAIDHGVRPYIDAWLAERAKLGVGSDRPLFCTTTRAGNVGGPINPSTVRQMLKRYAHKAGVTKRVHPHGLRHTHASELSQENIPVLEIRDQLGHEDLWMTARYISYITPTQRLDRISARSWPGQPAPDPTNPAVLSDGATVRASGPHPTVKLDPPEPRPVRAPIERRRRGRPTGARAGETSKRVLDAIEANGGTATQAQLRRALDLTNAALLHHLHRLHEQERIMRAGLDRHRSIIWKVAPPPVVIRRRVNEYRQTPPGEGPRRVLDAVDTLGGRASQAELGRLLGIESHTVHHHCLTLEAAGQLERGGLDKSTSRRGSQVWRLPSKRPQYQAASGYSMRVTVPR